MRAAAAALFLLARSSTARADDVDVRMPLRGGFAWDGRYRASQVDIGAGLSVDFDIVRVGKHAAFEFVVDGDTLIRPDLPFDDRRSVKVRVLGGVGMLLRPRSSYAFVTEVTAGLVFDAKDVIGFGAATTIYAYPMYLSWNDMAACERSVLSIIGGGFAVWIRGGVDATNQGNGGNLAIGASVDLAKLVFSPLISFASQFSRRACAR